MSELKQTNQYAKAVSSIPGIVDTYLASKMKEAMDVVVQLQTNKLREEAQAENQEFLNQTSYAVAASLSEFELKKILIDKMEANKSIDRSDFYKNLYNALVESYNNDNDIMSSYGKSAHAEEPSHTVEYLGIQQDQEFVTGDNDKQPANKEVTKADWFKKPERPPTPDPDRSKRR
ncbi:hypothetical protein Tco_0985427 [Tanacetum coccineum]